jgi:hypothetical protein
MKVIIAGSRDITDFAIIEEAIEESGFEITEVVSGGAKGADQLGEEWAALSNVPVKRFPANWDDIDVEGAVVKTNSWGKEYNAKAGLNRNIDMAEYADALIAIDLNTTGTNHMINEAKKRELQVFKYNPNEKLDDFYYF